MDAFISMIFIVIFVLRMLFVSDVVVDGMSRYEDFFITFQFLIAVNAVLLWARGKRKSPPPPSNP